MRFHEYDAVDDLRFSEYEAIDDKRVAYEMLSPDGREEAQEEALDCASSDELIMALVAKGLPPYMERLLTTLFKRIEA